MIFSQFPELGLWRDFLERLKVRVWTLDEPSGEGTGEGGESNGDAKDGEGVVKEKSKWDVKDPEEKSKWDVKDPTEKPKEGTKEGTQEAEEEGAKDSAKENAKPKAKLRPRPRKGKPKPATDGTAAQGSVEDPVCWNFVTRNYCKNGDKCRYWHSYPPGYDPDKAKQAIRQIPVIKRKEDVEKEKEKLKRKRDPKTSEWAAWWRCMIRCVLPLSEESAAPVTDPEVRKLVVALWKDIVEWLEKSDATHVLDLFRHEPSSRVDPGGVIHKLMMDPADKPDWAFIPASDVLLVVGEGIVGVTCEGVMADGPSVYRRETFEEASQRLEGFAGAEIIDTEGFSGEPARKKIRFAGDDDFGAEEADLRPGSKVRLHSLVVTKSVNGMEGTCEKWDKTEGRWLVLLKDGSTATVRPENLEVLDNLSGSSRW